MGVTLVEPTVTDVPEDDAAEPDYAIKVSVSMPGSLVRDIRARVGKREFSRYIAEAAAHQLAMDKLGEIVDAYVAEHGPIPEGLRQEAEARWHEAFGR
jgi:hypothetical protein